MRMDQSALNIKKQSSWFIRPAYKFRFGIPKLRNPFSFLPIFNEIFSNGGSIGIFMNGALGGMVTADVRGPDGKDKQTWSECRRIGHLLADEAMRIIYDTAEQKNPKITCSWKNVTLPVDSPLLLSIMKNSPLKLAKPDKQSITTRVNLVNIFYY